MDSNVYEKLRAHLDTFPAGFPDAEDNASIELLKILFTPEEAELALRLNLMMDGTPGKTSRTLAGEMGKSVEQVESLLESMAKKGLIYLVGEGEATFYSLLGFFPGIFEYNTDRFNLEFNQLINKILKAWGSSKKTKHIPMTKIVPVNRSLSSESKVYPYESVIEAIKTSSSLCLIDCVCRSHKKVTGEDCGRPIETCLYMNEFGDHALRIGKGRRVTVEEAIEVVTRAEDAGLIHLANNAQGLQGICSCCGCCCLGLQAITRMKNYDAIVKSDFDLKVDSDLCTGCGTCIDRCWGKALSLKDEKVIHDRDLCIGCGSCAYMCPTEALRLERKPADKIKPMPSDFVELMAKMGGK